MKLGEPDEGGDFLYCESFVWEKWGCKRFIQNRLEVLAKPFACRRGTGILPVFHGRDAHATRGFARTPDETFERLPMKK